MVLQARGAQNKTAFSGFFFAAAHLQRFYLRQEWEKDYYATGSELKWLNSQEGADMLEAQEQALSKTTSFYDLSSR